MKKVSLIVMGLALTLFCLQSFVKAEAETTDKTVLTVAIENWSTEAAPQQILAKLWRFQPCTTNEGTPGTICAYGYPNGNPACPVPTHVPECIGASGS